MLYFNKGELYSVNHNLKYDFALKMKSQQSYNNSRIPKKYYARPTNINFVSFALKIVYLYYTQLKSVLNIDSKVSNK